MIFVTGGAGFIGANFVLDWLPQSDEPIVNIDKLTYAGNLESLASLQKDSRHIFVLPKTRRFDKSVDLVPSLHLPIVVVSI